jgi:superfamily II DNA or RNA helicase
MSEKINLFKSLFKGREDIFAVRWEKGNKSGYSPAYFYDPYRYRVHRISGGTFQNFEEKSYLKLSDEEIEKHLKGVQQIGLYPLLKDNTSWFIAADFDKENWIEQCRKFLEACKGKNIPAYLERSRSGKGGHVWIFFEQVYPAVRSRKIFISILEEADIFSVFDKSSSFDRLFPNQDFLSGKGFGNLIALPLFGKTLEQGNNCFIDPDTLEPYSDQWKFLVNIKRIAPARLDSIYETLSGKKDEIIRSAGRGKLSITLGNDVRISRDGLIIELINYLKEELNFSNTEFFVKKKTGRNTFGTDRYFRFVEDTENEVIIPRGFTGKLIRFCRENKIEYDFVDKRKNLPETYFSFQATLREHQKKVIDIVSKKDLGVIVAPPGSGKTVVGLKIISDKKRPALIITHRKQIAEQWIERIEVFLGIPKNEIGRIGQGKNKIGKQVTVAMIQSLSKEMEKPDGIIDSKAFGTIIIDECHHIPAETFRNTVSKLSSYYLYGLTATPLRKYNDGKLIFIHLGKIIAEIKSEEISTTSQAKVIIRNTELDIPFNSKTDQFETLSKILIHDSARNKLILNDVNNELKSGKKAIIITERKEHIDSLYQFLKQSYETITLSGEDSESSRNRKWKVLKEGNYQALITTGQFFGEGTDLQNANCLFLVYPFSFEGKLIQYIGRVQRSQITPTIYDYRDIKIDYLNKMFLKRNTYYRKIDRQAMLFDDPVEIAPLTKETSVIIDQKVKIPLNELEFRYGGIAFKYIFPDVNRELEFDIENIEVRPEFEVLKPYFAKVLKMNNVNINVYAEFENGKLISQIATSSDIQKINREVIEGVKFRFVNKYFLGKESTNEDTTLLNIDQLQKDDQVSKKLYNSGEELLNDLLKNKQYKHEKQLNYLADKHARNILKLRFILSPFSFVFLLTGKEGFHIVLETLDTEEATYIWHFDNEKRTLPDKLRQVDKDLSLIKNKGRQEFLKNPPDNFSRIVHDYSDNRKGFIIWKDMLEERLT